MNQKSLSLFLPTKQHKKRNTKEEREASNDRQTNKQTNIMNLLTVAIIATYLGGAAIGANAKETIVHVETEWDPLEEVRYLYLYLLVDSLFVSFLFCSNNNNNYNTALYDTYYYRFSWAGTRMCSQSIQPVRRKCSRFCP